MNDPRWDAVFWDIGGVILSLESVQRAHGAFVDALCEQVSCRGDTEDALDRWRAVVGEYFAEREEMAFRPAREGYDRAVREIVDGESTDVEWRPLLHDVLARTIEPNDGAVATVRALQEGPWHVGVISDVDHDEGERILATFDVLDGFDSVTTSEAVGRTKPHPEMFETALAEAGVEPDEAVMIGDRYRNDMEGAKQVGMTTIASGADDGPAVDYRVSSLDDVLEILGGDRRPDQ
ncbi:MAG: HAD family hydrolase [Halanaeroarchaeum sp.]